MTGKAGQLAGLRCRHLDQGDQALLLNVVLTWIKGFAVGFGWEEEFITSHQILFVLDYGSVSLYDE